MANEIKLKLRVDDDGNLKVIAKNSEKAAKGLDKTAKSARTADRNLKGAAQASANGTKNFSKMAQGISGGLVPAYATLAAQVFAISAAFQFLSSASQISNLIAGQEALAATSGVAYKTITQGIKDATDGQLQYAEAAQAAAIGTASGLSPDQLNRLASSAKVASVALGRDLTDSFNRLIRGVTKAEPELLDELGIILRLETATRKYALSIGKNVRDLTAFERSQAVANEVLEQAETKFGKLEKIIDPNVFALNKFTASFDNLLNTFKSGVIETLRPVFLFLSENTIALTSALGLVALPIIKSILPSFEDWGKAAGDALKDQERRLNIYNKKLDKTRTKLKAFNKTLDEQKLDLSKQAEKIIGPVAPSKKGGSGADFLLGRSDSRAAKANAKKILDNARAQIERHGTVITGFLKGKNAEQVADLQRSYARRTALLKGFEQQHKLTWQKAGTHIKMYALQAQASLGKVKKAAITAGAGIARGLGAISAAAGWLGIITLVGTAVYELYRYFVPIPEEVKAATEAFKDFEEKTKTLNEELERTFKTLKEPGLLTLKEEVEAVGNAINSADLINKFNELTSIDKKLDPEGFEKAQNALKKLAGTVIDIAPEYKKFIDEFLKTGQFTKEQLREISALNEKYISASQASQRWAQSTNNLNRALDSVQGSVSVRPYDELLTVIRANIQENIKYNQVAIPAAIKRVEVAKEEVALARKAADGTEESNKRLIATGQAAAEAERALADLARTNAYLVRLEKEFSSISGKTLENENKILANRKKIATERTLGITFEQRAANLSLKRLERRNKELIIENKLLAANATLKALDIETQRDEYEAQERLIRALENEQYVILATNRLAKEKENTTRTALKLEEDILDIKNEQFDIEQRLGRLAQQQAGSRGGLTGSFGLSRAREQAAIQEQIFQDTLNKAKKSLEEAQRAEEEIFDVFNTTTYSEKEIDRRMQATVSAQASVDAAQLEIEVYRNRGEEILNSIKAENELLTLKQRTLSISSVENRFQETILLAQQKGIVLTRAQQKELYKQIEAQERLNLIIELQQGLYNTLESGFTNAFNGIIQGTTTVKDAFANLARSVLQYLSQMIAKMLVFQLIQLAISGFMGGAARVDAASVNALGGGSGALLNQPGGGFQGTSVARYGGMFEPSMRMGGISEGYAMGGIAKGRQAGYPAILHGTEAVVPLPNGKEIPVQMMNGGAQSNNVVVNVNVDNNGNSQQNTNADQSQGANLGNAIAAAVQRELQNQKRSGGILSPYGAA